MLARSPLRLLKLSRASSVRSLHSTAAIMSKTRFTEVSSRIHDEYNRGPDVWSMFNPVVFPTAVNLGQGFMNWAPPQFFRDALVEASGERVDTHHYSHPKGRPRLRKALSSYLSESIRKPKGEEPKLADGALPKLREDHGEVLDPETEIQITSGANGGIFSIMTAFLNPGDEVILLEPFFDQYHCEITYLDGKPIYVPLLPPAAKPGVNPGADEWKVDWAALEKAFASPKVKIFLFNTPHNPTGKVFDLEEMSRMAALAIKYDVLIISDEVYDCLTYEGHPHIRIGALEGMWERTLTVGSAGKSFACTGSRIGWVYGAPHLVKPTLVAHTRIVFTCNSAASEATAVGLEKAPEENFFPKQIEEYTARREKLSKALDHLGIPYTQPHGSYFIVADFSALEIPDDFEYSAEVAHRPRDFKMAWFLGKICNVVTIPMTAFVSDEHAHLYEQYLRFSFCKDGGEIEEATKRLEKLRPYMKQK